MDILEILFYIGTIILFSVFMVTALFDMATGRAGQYAEELADAARYLRWRAIFSAGFGLNQVFWMFIIFLPRLQLPFAGQEWFRVGLLLFWAVTVAIIALAWFKKR